MFGPHPPGKSIAPDVLLGELDHHVLDFDDTALCGHPSAVLAPAILASCRNVFEVPTT